jgi:hypothetical protein
MSKMNRRNEMMMNKGFSASGRSCNPAEIINGFPLHPAAVTAKIGVEAEMVKKGLTILCSMLLILTARLFPSEFNVGVNYGGYYSDNIFMNASQISDYVSLLQADLNLSVKKFNLTLAASAGIYNENPEFNSFSIEPGIEFFHSLKGRNAVFVTVGYAVLDYKELFSDFNYSGPKFQVNVKLHAASQALIKAGYTFEYRKYPNYSSFDFYNHKASVEINRFFKSQTNVQVEAGFNYRYYPHIVQDFDFGDDYNYYDNKKSQGKWKHQGTGHHSPMDPPSTDPGSGEYSYDSMGVPNLYGLLRVTHGFGTRVGLTGEAELRKNFRGLDNAEALIKNSYIIYPFTDDYLWDGLRLGLTIKAVLFKGIAAEGAFSYFDKHYPGIYIMDAEGNVVEPALERDDSLLLYSLRLSKKIGKLDLSANVLYRDNTSNDDYFHYNMLTISAGIGYYF